MSSLDKEQGVDKYQLCLTLLAALGVTALGTDLLNLVPSYGLRGVGGLIAKTVYQLLRLLPSTFLPGGM